ncbi:MAG: toxin HicA [Deltaproteobacteria bacterium]|nr:toxin HicA [Deltaproteobacteria bacterium]
MAHLTDMVAGFKKNPGGVRFKDLCKVCDHYFGKARQRGTSHRIYKTPWQGDPRVNIQNDHGYAKSYQVRQVLCAIEKLKPEASDDTNP